MMSNPAPSSARRLVVGSSNGSPPGMASRRRAQNSGWMTTGMLAAEPPDEPGQPGGVVKVTVAADDHLDVFRVAPEAAQVAGAAGRGEPGVEQQPAGGAALADLHQNGESVLGHRPVARFTGLQRPGADRGRRRAGQRAAQREPPGRALAGQQEVDRVVADGEHRHRVNRLKGQYLAGPGGVGSRRAALGTCTSPGVSHTSVHLPTHHGPAASVTSRAADDVPKIRFEGNPEDTGHLASGQGGGPGRRRHTKDGSPPPARCLISRGLPRPGSSTCSTSCSSTRPRPARAGIPAESEDSHGHCRQPDCRSAAK